MSMTLDEAAEAFESAPSSETAKRLREVAGEYHRDEMISDETLEHYFDVTHAHP